jgi:hypothetical protein
MLEVPLEPGYDHEVDGTVAEGLYATWRSPLLA